MRTIKFYVLPKRPGYVRELQVDENAPLSDALAEIEKDVPTWPGSLFYLKAGTKRVRCADVGKSLVEVFDGKIPDDLFITRCDAKVFNPDDIQKLRNMLGDMQDFLKTLIGE